MQPLADPIVFMPPGRPPTLPAACAVAVGNFDGVHVGHAAIASRLLAAAARRGVPAVVLTFDPHPASVVRPGAAPVPLTTPSRRAELLLAQGLDAVLVQPADAVLVGLSAKAFYGLVLRERLGALAIVEGGDFRFGAGRAGDVALLESLCAHDGVTLEVVPPVVVDGAPVSSSRLRALVAAGSVREANALATAAYRVSGTVVPGARRGAGLGFPTANLAEIATLVPGLGVYAARAVTDTGAVHRAAVHVGPPATFGGTAAALEVHLVGFTGGDLYGRRLDVDFLARLRDTRRFASADDLRAQLALDVRAAVAVGDETHGDG